MKGLRRYLIISALLLVAYLLAQYYKPTPTDWTATYLKEDKIPFGLYILDQQIKDIFPAAEIEISKQRVYNTLKKKDYKNASYLFIASGVDIDKTDLKKMLSFIEQGNHVFIATFDMAKALSDTLKLETNSTFNYTKQQNLPVNFTNPALKSDKGYVFEKGLGDQYFSKFDTSRVTVLGKNSKGDANFIKYNFGKGAMYVLPNPQLLTNYSLLNPAGAEYAAKALSYLPASKVLIWDEFNTRGNENKRSDLHVIFANEKLSWAYYLSLIGLVIFVLFEMKRRQRIIPIIDPLKNSSVEFVKVVGKVYYQQRDNRDIALKKSAYFLEHIRSTYYLKTMQLDAELEESLALKSGAGKDTINQLFAVIKNINKNSNVDDELLIILNKLIEQFYKQAQ